MGPECDSFLVEARSNLADNETVLAIFDAGGAMAMSTEAFANLTYAQDGAVFVGDMDGTVDASELLLISTSRYLTG